MRWGGPGLILQFWKGQGDDRSVWLRQRWRIVTKRCEKAENTKKKVKEKRGWARYLTGYSSASFHIATATRICPRDGMRRGEQASVFSTGIPLSYTWEAPAPELQSQVEYVGVSEQ
jgi:hypothetical protein